MSRAITLLASCRSDIPNPFARFVNITSTRPGVTPCSASVQTPVSSNSNNESSPRLHKFPPLDRLLSLLHLHKFQTTNQAIQHSRLQLKQSHSPSRRPKFVAHGSNSDGVHQSWHLSPNSHCNGGLNNAVDSAKNRLPQRLWHMREMCGNVPVWIPDGELESCYDEYCHQFYGLVSTT
ncbi:hypothetical protein EDD17DRAFT_864905 [Pisolithus thermaeus]|nr:hypothetical protein EDD17DRAFT_864905 [Pisolithus thermaeus]